MNANDNNPESEFAALMAAQGVTPLSAPSRIPTKRKPPQTARQQTSQPLPILRASKLTDTDNVTANSNLNYFQDGVHPQQRKALAQGKLAYQAQLDLHGHTLIQAELLLNGLIQQAQAQQQRCVLIIHGKGSGGHSQQSPALKNFINRWLRGQASVLGFCSAQPKHGGTGAVYALLKRS